MSDDYHITTNHAGNVICSHRSGTATLPFLELSFTGAGRFLSTVERIEVATAAIAHLQTILNRPAEPLPEWVN